MNTENSWWKEFDSRMTFLGWICLPFVIWMNLGFFTWVAAGILAIYLCVKTIQLLVRFLRIPLVSKVVIFSLQTIRWTTYILGGAVGLFCLSGLVLAWLSGTL